MYPGASLLRQKNSIDFIEAVFEIFLHEKKDRNLQQYFDQKNIPELIINHPLLHGLFSELWNNFELPRYASYSSFFSSPFDLRFY